MLHTTQPTSVAGSGMLNSFLTAEPLKMGPIGCPETSVRNYHNALRDIAEMRKPQIKIKFIISANNAKKKKLHNTIQQTKRLST